MAYLRNSNFKDYSLLERRVGSNIFADKSLRKDDNDN